MKESITVEVNGISAKNIELSERIFKEQLEKNVTLLREADAYVLISMQDETISCSAKTQSIHHVQGMVDGLKRMSLRLSMHGVKQIKELMSKGVR